MTDSRYPKTGLDPKPSTAFNQPTSGKSVAESIPKQDEWGERKAPAFIKFEKGELIEGVLHKIEQIVVNSEDGRKNRATRYTLQDLESGEMFCFLGSYDLDTKFRPSDVGHYVKVMLTGTDSSAGRYGNAMKQFMVAVSKTKAPGFAGDRTQITDDDIPF